MEPTGAPWRVLETTEPTTGPEPEAPPARPRSLPYPAIALALVAAVVAAAALLITARGDPVVGVNSAVGPDAGSESQGGPWPSDPASKAGAALRSDLVVAVGGAVARPGVYHLPAGARVADAIEAAGGFAPTVDAERADRELNLAAAVKDGDKIRVPVRGEAGASGGGASGEAGAGASGGSAGAGGLVDLNHASAEALDALPGVGPATAAKIIAAREERPFATVDELLARKVVGAAALAKLRPLVTVTP